MHICYLAQPQSCQNPEKGWQLSKSLELRGFCKKTQLEGMEGKLRFVWCNFLIECSPEALEAHLKFPLLKSFSFWDATSWPLVRWGVTSEGYAFHN